MAVRDPTSSLFPEVVAIEFDKVLFNTNTHVIVVVADICFAPSPRCEAAGDNARVSGLNPAGLERDKQRRPAAFESSWH